MRERKKEKERGREREGCLPQSLGGGSGKGGKQTGDISIQKSALVKRWELDIV